MTVPGQWANVLDMSKLSSETLRIMSSVEVRLNTLLRLEVTACGYEENIIKADKQWTRLMKYLEREIENLVIHGGAK